MNKVLTNMNQDLSALEKQIARGNIGAEDASNRVTSIDENSTDAQYPSAKCVFNALQNVGGGYKDGGQLVDGDFIEVKNNTVSSYDNTTRSNVNFYFELEDGEVINSVVNINSSINATIHVYKIENGFYIPIGYILNNTINAGENASITIIGDSFSVNIITDDNYPEFYDFGNLGIKNIYKINNYFWSADLGWSTLSSARSSEKNGWTLPTEDAYTDLQNNVAAIDCRSTTGWNNTQGTNLSKLNFYPYGAKRNLGEYWQTAYVGTFSTFWSKKDSYTGYNIIEGGYSFFSAFERSDNTKLRLRLVRHV